MGLMIHKIPAQSLAEREETMNRPVPRRKKIKFSGFGQTKRTTKKLDKVSL